MRTFDNLKQIFEQPNMISNKHAVRIYITTEDDDNVRYHLGFPSAMLPEQVWLLAETEPYLGEKHWTEVDGFKIFWLSEVINKSQQLPVIALQRHIVFHINSIKTAVKFFKSASE